MTAEFRIYYDGLCPVCRHEASLLRRLDRGRGRVRLVDFTSPDFDPREIGVSHEALMGSIHGLTGDGRLVTGMEVFRRAYGTLGWGWVWAPTGWPVLRPVFDGLYRIFARYRPRLSGARRCDHARCAVRRPPT
ncbi:MAG: DUF393 domain-containing protein [Phycisphaerales bacterium]|nr:DUF393 domain-containing protein [Phycisphaerales bacterium]